MVVCCVDNASGSRMRCAYAVQVLGVGIGINSVRTDGTDGWGCGRHHPMRFARKPALARRTGHTDARGLPSAGPERTHNAVCSGTPASTAHERHTIKSRGVLGIRDAEARLENRIESEIVGTTNPVPQSPKPRISMIMNNTHSHRSAAMLPGRSGN